jgi:hypothetical protein
MKTYEKYLITDDSLTEAKTMGKRVASLKKKLMDAMTLPDIRVAGAQVVKLIKSLDDDKISKELVDLLTIAKKRVKE